MAQELCLLTHIQDLGEEGDVVKVADGYARNYLLPQKLAMPLTPATRRQLEKRIEKRRLVLAGELAAAKELAAQLAKLSCTIAMKAGPEGKLFGSVGAADIARVLKDDHGIEMDKHKIDLPEPVKELGLFTVAIKLYKQVGATLKVHVVEE